MKFFGLLESVLLTEKLGNLAQLNLGPLADILKQDNWHGVGKKFSGNVSHTLSSTSEIIDAGDLKNGLAGLRKAYRAHDPASGHIAAFAVYLAGHAVAFGLFDAYSLAGKTRSGMFSYNLNNYKDQLQAVADAANKDKPSWRQTPAMKPSSAYDKEERSGGWRSEPEVVTIKKFAGNSISVDSLSQVLDIIHQIGNTTNQPVTLKLVVSDVAASNKRSERYINNKVVQDAGKELAKRLIAYKNSKRPTADTIQDFIRMVMGKEAAVVNFGGQPWRSAGNSYNTVDPMKLMSGVPFVIQFASATPDSYNHIAISFRYNSKNNQIVPWQARYRDEQTNKDKIIPIDLEMWATATLDIPDLEKPTVIKKMLTMLKNSPTVQTFDTLERAIGAFTDHGVDWPEFEVIKRSIAAERNKKATGA